MQLVVHSPFGSRVNRAWGLALRKRFCRSFNFELQAAATEDAIVLSLTTAHSFELEEVARYLHSNTVRPLLVQALCAAPMFPARWRWSAAIALALPRFRGGRKVPAPLARMAAEDLLASVFPDQVACAENLTGELEIPDHPLVRQAIRDCLEEAMDIEGLEALLRGLESGAIRVVARDLTEPSPLALEVLSAQTLRVPRRCAARGAAHAGGVESPLARPGGGGRSRRPRSGGHRPRARGGLAGCGRSRRAARCALLADLHDRGRGRQESGLGRMGRHARSWRAERPACSIGGATLWVAAERLPLFQRLDPAARRRAADRAAPGRICRVPGARTRRSSRSRAAACKAWGRSPPPSLAAPARRVRRPHDIRARGAAGGRIRDARPVHRRGAGGWGMVRARAARAHPSLHGEAPARRDRAGRAPRSAALPARVAARRAAGAHGGPGRRRRRPRAARGLRGAGRRLGNRDPAGTHQRVRPGLAR